jgi:glycosyltransferase 2 family protein
VARQIRGADPLLLGLAVLVSLGGFLFRAQRWRILLRPVSREVPFNAALGATMVGFAVNNLLPARLGELARAYALGRSGAVSASGAFGALVLERLLDGVVLLALLFAVMAAPGFPLAGAMGVDPRGAAVLTAAVFVSALVALRLVIARPRWLVRAAERGARILLPLALRERIARSMGAFIEGTAALRDVRLFAVSAAWAAAQWIFLATSYLLAFHAFGIREPGLGGAVFLQSLVTLAVAIPSSPGFFGPFEAAARLGLELWNVPAGQAVSFAIGFHLAGFVPVTVIGLLYAWRMGLGVRDVRSAGAALEPAADGERP